MPDNRAPTARCGRLWIDLSALARNYAAIAARVAPATAAAVVKADAYGLGSGPVASALWDAGCRRFFVAHLDEALAIRDELPPQAELIVLNGLPPGAEPLCARHGIVPVLNSLGQAERWAEAARALDRRLPAVLQLDSGMSRLGLAPEDGVRLAHDDRFRQAVDLRLVMSHLASSGTPGSKANAMQIAAFDRLAAAFPGVPRSLANSGGAFLAAPYHKDVVRAGIALYGGSPSGDPADALEPVVRLDARVVQVRTVPEGTGVGYDLTHRCTRPTRIATIGVGYADGLPRALGNRGAAWFDGRRLPILGRVSMDSITLDVSDLPAGQPAEGDWVEIIGPHQPVDVLARDAGTISYEILTSLGHRYDRHYLPFAGVNSGRPT